MRASKVFTLFLLFFLHAAACSAADSPVRLEDTESTEFRMEEVHEDVPLLRLTRPRNVRSYIQGWFRNPWDSTAGIDFHFFPNGKFAIDHWCDICIGTTLLVAGDWRIEGTQLVLASTYLRSDKAGEQLKARYNTYERFEIFAIAKNKYSGNTVLVAPDLLTAKTVEFFRYLERRDSYVDWQAVYEKLVSVTR